jgi:hypothetical protein
VPNGALSEARSEPKYRGDSLQLEAKKATSTQKSAAPTTT